MSVAAPQRRASIATQARYRAIAAQAARDGRRLDGAAFGPFALTALGIASVVGAGIFVTTGVAAATAAGPAVVLSFLLAAVAAAATALCYAELSATLPVAGGAYSYAYVAFGLFPAWFIGWDLLLEYLIAAATVASGWSGYSASVLASAGLPLPTALSQAPPGGVVNLPALVAVLACTALLIAGTRQSACVNAVIVVLKLAVLVLVVVLGARAVNPANWSPFDPEAPLGVLRGAGLVFFAYVGFDAVSTAASETRDPQRTVPRALLATVAIATALYVAVALVLTGLVPSSALDVADPISHALEAHAGLGWLDEAVAVAAVIGLFATVLVTLYGQVRVLLRMAADGLLPPAFARIDARRRTPVLNTLLCGGAAAAVAALVPIDVLGQLVSIGTLLAFVLVCGGVLVLRRSLPDVERPFRLRRVELVAGIGLAGSLGLMATLPTATWVRLVVWLALGVALFLAYGRRHARFGEGEA